MSRRRDTTYTPAPYAGDGLEVVANISSETAPTTILVAVAKWHERRKDGRNRVIASSFVLSSRRMIMGGEDEDDRHIRGGDSPKESPDFLADNCPTSPPAGLKTEVLFCIALKAPQRRE